MSAVGRGLLVGGGRDTSIYSRDRLVGEGGGTTKFAVRRGFLVGGGGAKVFTVGRVGERMESMAVWQPSLQPSHCSPLPAPSRQCLLHCDVY